ncbi:sodium/iodide cotransporter-like [Ylistrum balloti]|uniref:sodium/iodide cotransporter-like n=1 Tax=Ylistrum balloti TaxID=509963 RepID=UPI002905F365|nr:sodium/iodide cotransporter-like [Ylistrum balloti]
MTFLKWEDYAIIAVAVIMSLGVGLYVSLKGRKHKTTSEYLLGSGQMTAIPVAISLVVSYESGIAMLGVPAEVYMYGMQWYWSNIGFFFADLLNRHLLVPTLKRLEVTSIFEYLELRFKSHGIRMFATVLSILSGLNYLGTVLFVPAATLEEVAGIPDWVSIVGVMVVVVIYTYIGGFQAVVWSDVIQAILMYVGISILLIKGTIDAGGVAATWTSFNDKGRMNLFNFDPDPTLRQSFWSLVVGSTISGLGVPLAQVAFLRIKATPTVKSAKRMYLYTAFAFLITNLISAAEGVVLFAYYNAKGCDPLESKEVDNPNQLIANMVVAIFKNTPCLPGLYLAAIFSASLSTMSSTLNGLSTLFWEDIVKPHTKSMSNRKSTIITQLSVLVFGAIGVVIAFLVSGIEDPIVQIFPTTSSCLKGAITGIFLLGLFCPRANSLGAIVSGCMSCALVGWLSIGRYVNGVSSVNTKLEPASMENCIFPNVSLITNTNMSSYIISTSNMSTFASSQPPDITTSSGPEGVNIFYAISYKWLRTIGILTVLIAGSLISRLRKPDAVDKSLTVPVGDLLCSCIPKSFRRKYCCGSQYHSSTQDDISLDDIQLDHVKTSNGQ